MKVQHGATARALQDHTVSSPPLPPSSAYSSPSPLPRPPPPSQYGHSPYPFNTPSPGIQDEQDGHYQYHYPSQSQLPPSAREQWNATDPRVLPRSVSSVELAAPFAPLYDSRYHGTDTPGSWKVGRREEVRG